MRIPGQIQCDLCGSVIAHENRLITISIPLTEELRRAIMEVSAKNMPAGILNIMPFAQMVPRRWSLEACACVISLLPMLPELLAADVKRSIDQREQSQARAEIGSLEDL